MSCCHHPRSLTFRYQDECFILYQNPEVTKQVVIAMSCYYHHPKSRHRRAEKESSDWQHNSYQYSLGVARWWREWQYFTAPHKHNYSAFVCFPLGDCINHSHCIPVPKATRFFGLILAWLVSMKGLAMSGGDMGATLLAGANLSFLYALTTTTIHTNN